jgi:hypothetical protein
MANAILEQLKKAILDYDPEASAEAARKAIAASIAPTEILAAMTEAIREIGDGFNRGDLSLPDLVGGADAMSAATPIVEEEIKRVGAQAESTGVVVIGTAVPRPHRDDHLPVEDAPGPDAERRDLLGVRWAGGAHRAHPERGGAPGARLRLG